MAKITYNSKIIGKIRLISSENIGKLSMIVTENIGKEDKQK